MLDDPPDWSAIEAIGTWVAAIGTVGAIWVALSLAGRDRKSRRTERRGEIVAMCADVYHARQRLETLVSEKIQAPLYRIPDSTFANGLPKLIGDGRLKEGEIGVLLEYADKVAESIRLLKGFALLDVAEVRVATRAGIRQCAGHAAGAVWAPVVEKQKPRARSDQRA